MYNITTYKYNIEYNFKLIDINLIEIERSVKIYNDD